METAIGPSQNGQIEFQNHGSVNSQVGQQTVHGSVYLGPITNYNSQRIDQDELVGKVLNKQRNDRLRALSFDTQFIRCQAVKPAYGSTCEWALDRPEYIQWLDDKLFDSHNGFLWIKGKPGTGKSTLMKFLISKNQRSHIATFFFNARGGSLERTTIGMYRSLLMQIFTSFPHLQDILDSIEPRIDRRAVQQWDITHLQQYLNLQNLGFEWRLGNLEVVFRTVLQRLTERLVLFVDALDECDEDEVRDMVEVFEDLGSEPLRVCFSSRHYPNITIDKMVSFTLEEQKGHDHDLQVYLDSKLRVGNSQMETIKTSILARSAGIFLWVVLVVQQLRKDYDHGLMHKLQDRIDRMPLGLQALFDDILVRDGIQSELILCLQLVMFAVRPLSPEELYVAVRACTESQFSRELQSSFGADKITRYVLSISKGMIEEIPTQSGTSVQLIHESVRQFLLDEWSRRDYYFGSPILARSHDSLKQCCRKYFESCFTDRVGMKSLLPDIHYPFLDYAMTYLFYHCEAAEHYGMPQDLFRSEFQQSMWKFARKCVAGKYAEIDDRTVSMSAQDLLMFSNLCFSYPPSSRPEYVGTLYAALEWRAMWTFKIKFLQIAIPVSEESEALSIITLIIQRCPPPTTYMGSHHAVFFWAVRENLLLIVRFYVQKLKVDINKTNITGQRALYLAALLGYPTIVSCLLDAGADVNLFSRHDIEGGTRSLTLVKAAELGASDEVMEILKADQKWPDMVKHEEFDWRNEFRPTRITFDPHVLRSEDVKENEVSVATKLQDRVRVKALLDAGMDPNSGAIPYGTCVNLAASYGDVELVKLFIEHNASLDTCWEFWGGALYIAARRGDAALCEVLLRAGANVNLSGGYFKTPLGAAVGSETFRILSDAGGIKL